ncbi:histidine phosphatase family protein [Phaeodactylibacter sp.]|uniref:histidine phosphatase family protein n=1 Tax=Phaeodactylibacter sp. TaxID=1940289 RepID=UPI0025EA5A5E|nr:histidine phosphatase family protein [Phaeodactylibacter sp.]MCI4651387.1 histidine phosphatase family protein [Phaeodactylibacter sp.]MCI5094404.1 histidine phosphatase family protein [Phaeodactylibacter sp.]
MDKHVYIVRHGQTEYNRLGIVQGSGVDSSLNEVGKLQAQAFYDHYHSTGFDTVLTSSLKRTHETMAPFIGAGLPWEQHSEINEICWGTHEGQKSTPDMHLQYKAVTEAWASGDFDARLEEAESAREMGDRLAQFVHMLSQRPEKRILVCSHGRAMRALMCILSGKSLREMDTFKHHNTGLYKAAYESQQYTFLLENDIAHLQHLNINQD